MQTPADLRRVKDGGATGHNAKCMVVISNTPHSEGLCAPSAHVWAPRQFCDLLVPSRGLRRGAGFEDEIGQPGCYFLARRVQQAQPVLIFQRHSMILLSICGSASRVAIGSTVEENRPPLIRQVFCLPRLPVRGLAGRSWLRGGSSWPQVSKGGMRPE